MISERALREKLRKIENLFAGASTEGERTAAGLAAERIRERLRKFAREEKETEMKFSIPDPWQFKLFAALCRRYGLTPYRYPRMHSQTVLIRAPSSFVEAVLWPEFEQLAEALASHLSEITDRIIREEIHSETRGPEKRRR